MSILMKAREWVAKKSNKPWAVFETAGPDRSGRMEFNIRWNKAFVDNLLRHGFTGDTDEELVQTFFLSTRVLPENLITENVVNPEATPRLSSEANNLVK
jgi:hypothetical protein